MYTMRMQKIYEEELRNFRNISKDDYLAELIPHGSKSGQFQAYYKRINGLLEDSPLQDVALRKILQDDDLLEDLNSFNQSQETDGSIAVSTAKSIYDSLKNGKLKDLNEPLVTALIEQKEEELAAAEDDQKIISVSGFQYFLGYTICYLRLQGYAAHHARMNYANDPCRVAYKAPIRKLVKDNLGDFGRKVLLPVLLPIHTGKRVTPSDCAEVTFQDVKEMFNEFEYQLEDDKKLSSMIFDFAKNAVAQGDSSEILKAVAGVGLESKYPALDANKFSDERLKLYWKEFIIYNAPIFKRNCRKMVK